MASFPPPPDEPTPASAPVHEPAGPGPSSKTTILAIVASVAVIAILGTVIAIANSDGGSSDASPSASPPVLAPPGGLVADATAFRVVLTWTAGEGAPAVRYLVSRDGSVAKTLDPDATRWVDDDVKPETRYSYRVSAVGADGTSVSSGVVTRTRTAPLATARLDGTFDVHVHATSHYGFSDFGSGNGNLGWRFMPTCSHDPCDTTLTDLHLKAFRLKLAQQGSSYHGDASLNARVRCGGTPVVSNVSIVVRVTDAGIVHGDWVATKIEGTMRQSESAQLGCVASGATYDLVGKVVVAGRAGG